MASSLCPIRFIGRISPGILSNAAAAMCALMARHLAIRTFLVDLCAVGLAEIVADPYRHTRRPARPFRVSQLGLVMRLARHFFGDGQIECFVEKAHGNPLGPRPNRPPPGDTVSEELLRRP